MQCLTRQNSMIMGKPFSLFSAGIKNRFNFGRAVMPAVISVIKHKSCRVSSSLWGFWIMVNLRFVRYRVILKLKDDLCSASKNCRKTSTLVKTFSACLVQAAGLCPGAEVP